MSLSKSKTVEVVKYLEKYLKILTYIGIHGAVLFGAGFLLYSVVSVLANMVGWFDPSYPVLSLTGDPIFNITGALTGLFISLGSGALLLYYFLVGFETERSQYVVLLGFISLGFGGAILRVTLPTAYDLLLSFI